MNTGLDNGAPVAPPSCGSVRIHRARTPGERNSKKILVVDDNAVILKTTSSKLQAAGYEVYTAEDGGSAIRQVRQLQPDLILMDLNFPPDVGHGGGIPWDGLLILSWLRRAVGAPKLPVIVITGGDLQTYKDRFVEAGVLDVFLKPIDHEALLGAIKWALDEEAAGQAPTPLKPSGQPPAEPSPTFEPATGRKILVVDDSSDWRYLASSFVGDRGYEIVAAEDSVSAMLKASQSKPNLVVLDLNLGGESAVPLLKALSQLRPEMPILIYTAMALNDAEVSELLKNGAWGWLRKGSMEELLTAIEGVISKPRPTIPETAAETAKTSITTEAAPESDVALPSLDALRTGTLEELLSAVESAGSVTPEPSESIPEEPPVSEGLVESAAGSVLIIEDDAAHTESLRSFLESQSFRVSAVSTGAEAMCLIALADVELILFDLTLPGFSVREFYDAVKAVKPDLCPRIIFMTSDDSQAADDGFVRRLKGVSVWKPFSMDWLLEAIQTVRAGSQQAALDESQAAPAQAPS